MLRALSLPGHSIYSFINVFVWFSRITISLNLSKSSFLSKTSSTKTAISLSCFFTYSRESVILVGNIDYVKRDIVFLRQVPESVYVCIADHRSGYGHLRLFQNIKLSRTQKCLVKTAQSVWYSRRFGFVYKGVFYQKSRHEGRIGFNKERVYIHSVQEFVGSKNIDPCGVLRRAQRFLYVFQSYFIQGLQRLGQLSVGEKGHIPVSHVKPNRYKKNW